MNSLLSSLNESQRAAVEYISGPELVIAGAGSGKTRVLTYKIAYLLSQGIKPWNILALTFTNKAAKEMKERIAALVGANDAHYLNMGTFHSIFLRILRNEAELLGLNRNFTIYDDSDSRTLINSIVKEMHLDDKTYKAANVLSRIGMAKNNLITPESYSVDTFLLERDHRSNMPKLSEIYRMYVIRCKSANAVDFDDMLMYTYMLFRNHPEVCQKYAERFKYILVDEYQDTNYAQQSIITLLTQYHSNICVVGDDAQSIYAFRGANIDNILNFQNIYRDSKLFKLEQNYRSTQNIVNAANCLIKHNSRQIKKNVFSENQQGDKVVLNISYSDKEEAAIVCNEIKRLDKCEQVAYGDIAVLYRTNAQSRLFEDELRRENIPYRIYGGMSFYQRKEIKDIIAYFRMVANPDDEEALKRIINYPKRGIGNTTVDKLIASARSYGVGLWSVVNNPTAYVAGIGPAVARKVVAFHDMIDQYIELAQTTDAYVLGKRIIEETGLSKAIMADGEDDANERIDNVEEFVSGLRDFVDTKLEEGYTSEIFISNFLQEVALMSDADKDDDDTDNAGNRVTLMTIHASKGLEFKAVFIVGVEENIFPSPRSCEFPMQLEEERRLFYVAITRAEQFCFISCAKSRYQYGNMMFNEPSRFLREINSDYMLVNGRLGSNRIDDGSNRYSGSFVDERQTSSNVKSSSFGNRQMSGNSRPTSNSNRPMPTISYGSFRKVNTSTPKPSTSSKHSNPTLAIGTVIEHMRFGIGTVASVEGSGENEKAMVNFENAGTKTLLLKFAKYKIVGKTEK
ncbi:ATP-dependent helicase [Prevotella merdae]|uniref:ATP-dependent helicase n=1 Tax=Prevotella merdae TaxID=2079531 RepID=UPI003F80AB7F